MSIDFNKIATNQINWSSTSMKFLKQHQKPIGQLLESLRGKNYYQDFNTTLNQIVTYLFDPSKVRS